MNFNKFFLSVLVIFIFALLWNGFVHMVLLRESDSILNTIGRSESDRSLLLSLIVTMMLALLFVWSYIRFAKQGNIRDGLMHGLFFGILAGVLVDLNQYILYPIPASLAISWFIFGLMEFCIYGIIASKLYPIKTEPAAISHP
jgi:hypothetical protein